MVETSKSSRALQTFLLQAFEEEKFLLDAKERKTMIYSWARSRGRTLINTRSTNGGYELSLYLVNINSYE